MPPVTVPFGSYELIRKLARGGMAEIFLAVEHGIEGVKRQVVIKRILPEMAESDDFVTMFMDEARVVARLNHPNIVHIYNFGEVDGIYFIAMEYVDGLTSSRLRRIASPKKLPIEYTLRIIADVCAGLHHAHELLDEYGRNVGVIHRDVTPQNIMVSRDGAAKLIDFGVARASTQSHSTQAGHVKGKFGYIAPEQFHRQCPIDRRCDIFSIGAVLFEMITGERLFVRESEVATLGAIIHDSVPSVLEFRNAPSMVDTIIQTAVEKEPRNRFSTALAMQEAIEDLMASSGLAVTPYTLGKYVTTHMEQIAHFQIKSDARAGIESMLPASYTPESQGGDSRPAQPSFQSHPPPYRPSPAPPAASSVTPPPASDLPRQRSNLTLIMAVVCVIFAIVISFGFAANLTRNSLETGETATASASPSQGGPEGKGPTETDLFAMPKNAPQPVPFPVKIAEQETPNGDGPSSEGDTDELVVVRSRVADPAKIGEEDQAPAAADAKNDRLRRRPSRSRTSSERDAQPPQNRDTQPPQKVAAEEAEETGTLFLNARPWCKVSLRGRNLGTTPIIGATVPVGTHTLRLVDAQGQSHSRRIKIRANQPTKLNINLLTTEE